MTFWPNWLRALIAGLVAVVLIAALVCGMWAGVASTRADRENRSRAAEACRSIDNEIIRSECIRGVS